MPPSSRLGPQRLLRRLRGANAASAGSPRDHTRAARRMSTALAPLRSSQTTCTTSIATHCRRSLTSTTHLNTNSTTTDSSFSTVSPDEVSHFNALASSWWDPQGPSRILHLMNPLRHDFIRTIKSSVADATPVPNGDQTPPGLTYLDIGCGGGIFAESAARLPGTKSVTALDPSPEVLAIAKAHARRDPSLRGKLSYVNTSIEALPVPERSQDKFDIVSIFEVLEHVSHPAQFLDRATPFVKPGGWLVMSTIARTWMSWFTTNLMAEDVLRIVPKGTHDWAKYVNEDELRTHFLRSRSGWGEARCMGVIYVPGVGWREVKGSEKVGNYFFAVRRLE